MHYNVHIIGSGKKPPIKNTEMFNNGNFASQEHNNNNTSFIDTRSAYDLMLGTGHPGNMILSTCRHI